MRSEYIILTDHHDNPIAVHPERIAIIEKDGDRDQGSTVVYVTIPTGVEVVYVRETVMEVVGLVDNHLHPPTSPRQGAGFGFAGGQSA